MAIELLNEDCPPAGEWKKWREDIEALIRAVPPTVQDRINRGITGGLKRHQLEKEPADRPLQRAVEVTRKMAAYALVDTRNFEITTQSPSLCKELTEAMGEPVTPGQAVKLDGRWSGPVNEVIFRFLPRFAKWVADESYEMARYDAEDEEELGKI